MTEAEFPEPEGSEEAGETGADDDDEEVRVVR